MKKLILGLALVLVSASLSAQTVTCSVSGATTKQTTQYAAMLAKINAERTAAGLPTYANFAAHCADMMASAFNSWVTTQNKVDAGKAATSFETHGDETATTAQCTAVSLGVGCTKAQVACVVLSGNATCS